jgi:5-methylcytosine-specific restriction enzyme A
MTRKYCKSFPCPNIAISGGSYCADHQPAKVQNSDHHDPFYSNIRWQKFRNWYLSAHPLCEHCGQEGRVTEATVVDHVVEIKDGGERFNDANSQALCRTCHARKTRATKNRRKSNRLDRIGRRTRS